MESSVFEWNWLSLWTHGGWTGVLMAVLLTVLSVLVWMVIVHKYRVLKVAQANSERFLTDFWESKSLSELNAHIRTYPHSPAREVFRAGFNEMLRILHMCEKQETNVVHVPLDTVQRSLMRQQMMEEAALATRVGFLAVCASAAPFLGLLGTVVGIVRAFHDIGATGASSLAAVAPGVSEALISTAMGLFVAIPAVVFYNALSQKVRAHAILLEGFALDLLNILQRHYGFKNLPKKTV